MSQHRASNERKNGRHLRQVMLTTLALALQLAGGIAMATDGDTAKAAMTVTAAAIQDDASSSSTNPPEASDDTAKRKRFSSTNFKHWGDLTADFGDSYLGDAGGVRSWMADRGFGGQLFVANTGWINTLNVPRETNGQMAYVGQKYTSFQLIGAELSYTAANGSQIALDAVCAASSTLNVYARGCRLNDLSYYYPFLNGKLEMTVGILPNDMEFVNTYVGGNTTTGAFGAQGVLPVQSGLSQQPGSAPGLDITYHFDGDWYDKFGLQRSLSPEGIVQDYGYFNTSGLRFSEPDAKALAIDEVGFKRHASTDDRYLYFRFGGLYNWSDYTNFRTGGSSHNWNGYLLGDVQLTQPDRVSIPYRGWYVGFSIMDSPSNVNVFQQYYEARVYLIAPFRSRPSDLLSIVATHSRFSGDAQHFFIQQGALPQKETTSTTVSYAVKVTHGIFIQPGISYTDHPSFITARGQGHDLNFFLSMSAYL